MDRLREEEQLSLREVEQQGYRDLHPIPAEPTPGADEEHAIMVLADTTRPIVGPVCKGQQRSLSSAADAPPNWKTIQRLRDVQEQPVPLVYLCLCLNRTVGCCYVSSKC